MIEFIQLQWINWNSYLLGALLTPIFINIYNYRFMAIIFPFDTSYNQHLRLGQYSAIQMNLPIFVIQTSYSPISSLTYFWGDIFQPRYSKKLRHTQGSSHPVESSIFYTKPLINPDPILYLAVYHPYFSTLIIYIKDITKSNNNYDDDIFL